MITSKTSLASIVVGVFGVFGFALSGCADPEPSPEQVEPAPGAEPGAPLVDFSARRPTPDGATRCAIEPGHEDIVPESFELIASSEGTILRVALPARVVAPAASASLVQETDLLLKGVRLDEARRELLSNRTLLEAAYEGTTPSAAYGTMDSLMQCNSDAPKASAIPAGAEPSCTYDGASDAAGILRQSESVAFYGGASGTSIVWQGAPEKVALFRLDVTRTRKRVVSMPLASIDGARTELAATDGRISHALLGRAVTDAQLQSLNAALRCNR
jgi:hypothetical protein